jgi:hypothetical protein
VSLLLSPAIPCFPAFASVSSVAGVPAVTGIPTVASISAVVVVPYLLASVSCLQPCCCCLSLVSFTLILMFLLTFAVLLFLHFLASLKYNFCPCCCPFVAGTPGVTFIPSDTSATGVPVVAGITDFAGAAVAAHVLENM